MTFIEIANRMNGISCRIFGISWTSAKLEINAVKKVITFLEDRRVLYIVYELKNPKHCIDSIIKIRELLTNTLFDVDTDGELGMTLKAMRNTCRKFLNEVQSEFYFKNGHELHLNNLGMGAQIHFFNAMGELRTTMGIFIAKILVMHTLDCESELQAILPTIGIEGADNS